MDRVAGFEPVGREFESLRVHHFLFIEVTVQSLFLIFQVMRVSKETNILKKVRS
jgi:hypothetical protein